MAGETGAQLRAGRALAGLLQSEIAERSGVSIPTIKRLEAVDGEVSANTGTINALVSALRAVGVILLPADENGGPGVRLTGRR